MIRLEVLQFANDMERVLENNNHKKGWQQLTPKETLSRIIDEVKELSDLINYEGQAMISKYRVIDEATDISNFCMFLVTNLRNQKLPFLED